MPLRGEKKNPILALRATLDYVTGPSDTPFWERSSIGGRRSLRGYNGDRFIGFNRSAGVGRSSAPTSTSAGSSA